MKIYYLLHFFGYWEQLHVAHLPLQAMIIIFCCFVQYFYGLIIYSML